MPEYDELLKNYTSDAAQALPPLIREAAQRLAIADEAALELLGQHLARAYMAGVTAGESEILAQVAEQGVEFTHTKLRAP